MFFSNIDLAISLNSDFPRRQCITASVTLFGVFLAIYPKEEITLSKLGSTPSDNISTIFGSLFNGKLFKHKFNFLSANLVNCRTTIFKV